MWHGWEPDGKFWIELTAADAKIAEQVRRQGCPWCGGTLHQANYPRKPRPWLGEHDEAYCCRFSFCCAQEGCRRRATPPSMRFFGRRVYVGAMVIWAVVVLLAKAAKSWAVVPSRTVARWWRWWQREFVSSECFRALSGRLLPPVEVGRLPAVLLERFEGGGRQRIRQLLLQLLPLTTASSRSPISMAALVPAEDGS